MESKDRHKLSRKKKPVNSLVKYFLNLLLIVLLCAWMFVLGILVGRGIIPIKFNTTDVLDKNLANLSPKKPQVKKTSAKTSDDPLPNPASKKIKDEFNFYKDLKKPVPVVKYKPPKTKTITKVKSVTTKPIKSKPMQKSAVRLNQTGKFAIQAASFRDATVAQMRINELRRLGYPAYLQKVVISNKGIWNRVLIGSFKTRAQGSKILKRLQRSHQPGFLITIKN